ncbi:5'-3' exonuclease [Gorillibacterium sp. sgz5001074]|uniref:5'-3' exonuclease n=1 Tax=Gorillibacterium sp. sgz5001074 TaxID=3446695 RepID=UPI003F660EEB
MLIDGMALLFRGFYATSSSGYIMRTKAGMPTNAVYGFMKYMTDAIRAFKPTHVVCCWDMGSKSFRTEKFGNYKGNRPEAPLEMIPQFDLVKEVTASFGIPNVGLVGYEADDCIGTLARKFGETCQVHILTGDHDMLQLIDDNVKVIIMKKGANNYMVYDPDTLLAEKSLSPNQIVDLKGLTGDTSDNYPGVKGIGEKTAVKLLCEYQDIEGILENLDKLAAGVKRKIECDLDNLHLSRELAAICCQVPVNVELHECEWRPDPEKAGAKLDELEFKHAMKWIS